MSLGVRLTTGVVPQNSFRHSDVFGTVETLSVRKLRAGWPVPNNCYGEGHREPYGRVDATICQFDGADRSVFHEALAVLFRIPVSLRRTPPLRRIGPNCCKPFRTHFYNDQKRPVTNFILRIRKAGEGATSLKSCRDEGKA